VDYEWYGKGSCYHKNKEQNGIPMKLHSGYRVKHKFIPYAFFIHGMNKVTENGAEEATK
jgi:hypothetical protein